MHFQGNLLLALAIPNFILASFILLRNTKDLTNLFFGIFILSAAFWSLGLSQYFFTQDAAAARFWAKAYYADATLIVFSFLGFSLSFTNNFKKFKTLYYGAGLLLFAAANYLVLSSMIDGIAYHSWGKEVLLANLTYKLYCLFELSCILAGFLALAHALRTANGVYRMQLQLIIAGLAIAYGVGATTNLLLPAAGNYRYVWVGPLFTLFYISAITYAIVKHRLFDIRSFVVRTFAYLLTLAVVGILAVFPAFVILNHILGSKLNNKNIIWMSVLTLLAALFFQSLRPYFNSITNRIFYRGYYDPQEVLDELSDVLAASVDLDQIKTKSGRIIKRALMPEKFEYLLRVDQDNHSETGRLLYLLSLRHSGITYKDNLNKRRDQKLIAEMDRANIAIAARLRVKQELLGFMLLGYKQSGAQYNETDLRMLNIAADETAVGLQNALRFEEIRRFNATLQEKVDNATKALQRANVRLRELDKTKDEFISMASHQLRTPLTTIKGYLSMILDGDVGKVKAEEKELIKRAFDSAENMVDLIADLLNISRLQSGKFVIENKPTDLAEMVELEVEKLQDHTKSKNLTLTYKKPASFPILSLDETKMRQVVMNFLDNAIFYTPAGGSVNVELEATKSSVIYRVKDTGVGVPKAVQHHLFSKFYRADNARKMRPDGTGLGLFMAKKVIIAQGGSIIFDSEEGKGSVFGFSFPRSTTEVKK